MGISVVRYRTSSSPAPQWGVLSDGLICRLEVEGSSNRDIMALYFDDRARFDKAIDTREIDMSGFEFLSPVSNDVQIFCQGLNYAEHRIEGGLDEGSSEAENLIFMNAASSICGPNDDIVRPSGCQLLDYEIELGLVMKSDLTEPRQLIEYDLTDLVGALVIANDVSARDFMFGAPGMQWFKGKSQRTFCPLGPVLYLLDEDDLKSLYQLELVLRLNGQVKQRASTELMIHKPAKTLSDLSMFTLLRTGDLILTGTPGGVQIGIDLRSALAIMLNMKNDRKRRQKFVSAQLARAEYLKPGDIIELQIHSFDGAVNLGTQRSRVIEG